MAKNSIKDDAAAFIPTKGSDLDFITADDHDVIEDARFHEEVNKETGEVYEEPADELEGEQAGTTAVAQRKVEKHGGALIYTDHEEMSVLSQEAVQHRIKYLHRVIGSILVEGTDYGIIPGTSKPTLYQSGAQKMAVAFRLRPEFSVSYEEHDNYHRTYTVKCSLYHIPTGRLISEGVGICSTLEGRYRFRKVKDEHETDVSVPKGYWDDRDQNLLEEALKKAGVEMADDQYPSTKKIKNQWKIVLAIEDTGERTEHDNPADYWNTCAKIAAKRGFVHGVNNGTGASEVFTQDVEDMSSL